MKLHNTTTFVYTNQPLYCDCFMQTKVFYISISYSEIQFYLIHSFFITTVHSNNLYVKSIVIFIDVRGAQKGNGPTPPALGKRAFQYH